MGNRNDECCLALAEVLRPVLGIVSYPMPASINATPHTVIFGSEGEPTYKFGSEQEWIETFWATIYIAPKTTPQAVGRINKSLELVRDLFSESNRAGYFLEETGGGPRVDFCQMGTYSRIGEIEYAGVAYYARELSWNVKRRRFDGAE